MQYLYQESHNRLFIWSEEFGKRSDMREATPAEIERLLNPGKWSQSESEPISDEVDLEITTPRDAEEEAEEKAQEFSDAVQEHSDKVEERVQDIAASLKEKPPVKRTRRRRK